MTMRITQQLLRSKVNGPLQSVEYLDLSSLGIVSVEKLNCCPKLQTLILRGNEIVEVSNLEHCHNLWRVDLSNNEIQSLTCLSRFVALGTLNLANNDLDWREIGKLRHLHIMELSLHGNKQLEKDPYYRIHIVDCLPHVWILDGRIITSAERLQVKHFFADSALTDHPIRRKLSKEWFVPSVLKKIEVNGIYGDKATHLMRRFPANGSHNIETDRRRLKYLAYNTQEDMMVEKKATKRDFQVLRYRQSFLEDILDVRTGDRERCNMLLLLLVATLEFIMPTHLVKETLETAKLSKIGKVYTMDLFLLPKDVRCRIVCILLSAVKVDKDIQEDGGLYDKLYLCLFYTVAELAKLCNTVSTADSSVRSKMTQLYRDYKCLLASEVVQLLCIVPAFFEYVDRDIGVMNLVVTATGDHAITEKIIRLSQNVESSGGDVRKLYEELSDFLLQKVQEQSMNLTNKTQYLPSGEEVFKSMKAYPMKGQKSPLEAADYHMKGISSPNRDPPSILSAKRQALKNRKHFPHLGDYLLLGPQTLGKIMGLPQPFLALVAMDSIPVANGAMESKLKQSEDHYTYVNMDQLEWDNELSFWKPRGSIGDSMLQEFLTYSNMISSGTNVPVATVKKGYMFTATVPKVEPRHYIFRCKWFTIHTIEDLRKELNRRANLTTDQIPRPNSPEDFMRSFPSSPGRESSTPLIFSTGIHDNLSGDSQAPKSRTQEPHPRPMSSLLMEKLDLKLDLTHRRVQSATERSSTHSPYSARTTPEKSIIHSSESVKSLTVEEGDSSQLEKVSADCVQCAIETAALQEQQQENRQETVQEKKTNGEAPSTDQTTQGQISSPKSSPLQQQHSARARDKVDADGLGHSDEEVELQNLNTGRPDKQPDQSEPPPTQPANEAPTTPVSASSSRLQVNIPQVELLDPEQDREIMGSRKGKARQAHMPIIKGKQSKLSDRIPMKSGKLSIQNKNRPFSAMDAYRFIVTNNKKPLGTDTGNITQYQQQRTEAWRQSTQNTRSETPQPHRHNTPPPQRPTSPERTQRPASALSVTRGNDWLAGGRDLYWETVQKRPRSGHVPGWKEGLPDSMKRPHSAVAARTLNRRSKSSSPVTPSSLAYERFIQGYGSPRATSHSMPEPQLPSLSDLNDYQPLYHHLGIPRRLGSPSSGSIEFYTQPTQDTVYSTPPSSPARQWSAGNKLRPLCMQCIYEELLDDESEQFSAENVVFQTCNQHSC